MTYNVLFLCTGNSARSIFAEAILSKIAADRFRAFSAGSHPRGQVSPYALEVLQRLGHDTSNSRSKSWGEFASPNAPSLDFVITLCDSLANEDCPAWPGQPLTAIWAIADPAATAGTSEDIA